jgi:hypothetical protein
MESFQTVIMVDIEYGGIDLVLPRCESFVKIS